MTTKDYQSFFDTDVFLNTYYKDPTKQMRFGYERLSKFFSQITQKDLKFLNYGGGPVISRLISACPHVQDFVFAEYLEANRQAVQAWINQDLKAFNWDRTFEYIVQELEGKGTDEVARRKAELRHKIRAVVPCDITAQNILEIPLNVNEKFGPPYDVVFTSLCVEAVVESDQEYKDAVTKLVKLVKPGGYLVMHGVLGHSYYTVGSKRFHAFNFNEKTVMESMKESGLKEIEVTLASSGTSYKKMWRDFFHYPMWKMSSLRMVAHETISHFSQNKKCQSHKNVKIKFDSA